MAAPRRHGSSGEVYVGNQVLVNVGRRDDCDGHVRTLYARVTRPKQRWVPVGGYCDGCGAVQVVSGDPA